MQNLRKIYNRDIKLHQISVVTLNNRTSQHTGSLLKESLNLCFGEQILRVQICFNRISMKEWLNPIVLETILIVNMVVDDNDFSQQLKQEAHGP